MEVRYPDAEWLPLPEAVTQARITPVLIIFHTIVGSAAGAIRIMQGEATPGESHMVNPFDGRLVQLMPFDRRADCNWRVNAWTTPKDLPLANGMTVPRGTVCGAISIESEDDGTPENTPWTPEQCESFAQFTAWAHLNLGIPIARPVDPFSPGVGYHSMPGLNRLAAWEPAAVPPFGTFVDPNGRTVNVYNPWTNTVGKSCPGPARIAQFDGILQRALELVNPTPLPSPPSEDDDMQRTHLHLMSATKGEWILRLSDHQLTPIKDPQSRTGLLAGYAEAIGSSEVSDAQLIAYRDGTEKPA